jgi:hypothetical protein
VPSVSKKQADFMRAVAHSPEFAKKAGVPQSVGKEFSNADNGRKFSKGGDMKHEDVKMDKAMVKKAIGKHAAMPASKAHKGLKSGGMAMVEKDGKKVPAFAADGVGKMKSGGMAKGYARGGGIETKGKTKGTMVKMARGGKTC